MFFYFYRLSFFALALCIMCSCQKFQSIDTEADLIGLSRSSLDIRDTAVEVSAFTFISPDPDTSIYAMFFSGTANLRYVALGSYEDQNFGKKTASLMMSLERANNKGVPFSGTGIIIDSVRLRLQMNSYYGDTLAKPVLNVYKLKENLRLYSSKQYYRHLEEPTYDNTDLLGTYTNNVSTLKNVDSNNQLNISLSNKLGETFRDAPVTAWDSAVSFNNFFKGIAVVPLANNSANTVFNINPIDTGTYLIVYYKSTESGASEATQKLIKFFFSDLNSGIANPIKWDKTKAEISNYLAPVTNKTNKDFVYLQTNYNTKLSVLNDNINMFPKNSVITKAELILTEVTPALINQTKVTPRYLFLYQYDADNKFIPIKDYIAGLNYYSQISAVGGYRIDTVDQQKQPISMYKFIITRYVQNVILGKQENKPFIIQSANTSIFLDEIRMYNQTMNGQVKLYSGRDANTSIDKKMYIKIYYSPIL